MDQRGSISAEVEKCGVGSAQGGVESLGRWSARAQLTLSELIKSLVHGIQIRVQILRFRIDIEQARYHFSMLLSLLQEVHGERPVVRLIIGRELVKPQY